MKIWDMTSWGRSGLLYASTCFSQTIWVGFFYFLFCLFRFIVLKVFFPPLFIKVWHCSRVDFFRYLPQQYSWSQILLQKLLFPPWKWHIFLLTWKLDEPVWLTWWTKCRVSDPAPQGLGDKRQYGFYLTLCSCWEPSHHVGGPHGIVPGKVSPDHHHPFQDIGMSEASDVPSVQPSSCLSWHQMGLRPVTPTKPCLDCRLMKKMNVVAWSLPRVGMNCYTALNNWNRCTQKMHMSSVYRLMNFHNQNTHQVMNQNYPPQSPSHSFWSLISKDDRSPKSLNDFCLI